MSTNNSRQAAWVAIGSFFSLIVGIVSPMILARYFEKGDYGTYKQVMYVYNTLLAVFTLGLPKAYAYFLPKYSHEYSKDIIIKNTKIFLALGGLFSLFLFVCAGPIATFLKNPDIKYALMVFSPTPLFLLPTMGLDGIYATFKRTQILAIYTIATRILTIVCIILPVVCFNGDYIHAIIGFDIASMITCATALYMKSLPVRDIEQIKSSVTLKQIFDFALPLLYASFWGMIIGSANQFFISRYYGNVVFAEFSNGFMELPFTGMISGAVAAILLPVFSGMDKGNGMIQDSLATWNSALVKSAKIIFPMLVYSVFFAELMMTCMYGDMYANSTIYFQIKNISGLFYIIPFAPIILAIGKTKEYARIHMIIAFVIIILEWIVVKTLASAVFIAIVSEICNVIKIGLMLVVVANYTSKSIKEFLPLKFLFKTLIISILASTGSYFAMLPIFCNKFIELGISLVIFLTLYYILCWLFRLTYRDIAISFFKQKRLKWIVKLLP